MLRGRWEQWVGGVEGAHVEGGLDEGASLPELPVPQRVREARVAGGEQTREGVWGREDCNIFNIDIAQFNCVH